MVFPCCVAATILFHESTGPLLETNRNVPGTRDEAPRCDTSQVGSGASFLLQEKNIKPSLLHVCDDLYLGRSRCQILQRAGFDVYSCDSLDATCCGELVTARFTAAILCHSIHPEVAITLARALCASNPELKAVRLSNEPAQERNFDVFHLSLQAPIAPDLLFRTMVIMRTEPNSLLVDKVGLRQ